MFRLWANSCNQLGTCTCTCELSDGTQIRERAANDQWFDWIACKSLHMCRECGLKIETQGGNPGLRTEQLGPAHLPGFSVAPTPVLLPHVRGMRHLKSEVPEHVCLNRMQLHFVRTCVCRWERAKNGAQPPMRCCPHLGDQPPCLVSVSMEVCHGHAASIIPVTFIAVITLQPPDHDTSDVYKNPPRKTFLIKAVSRSRAQVYIVF